MPTLSIAFQPPGPVAAAAFRSEAPVMGIMGPIGSAKTSLCLQRAIRVARLQRPGPDGVRRCRIANIRDTYPNLKNTTIASWFTWVPKELGAFSGDHPITHRLVFDDGKGPIELEMQFIALGENRIEDVMRGAELTGAYLNEADLLPPEVLGFVNSRVGRYPSKLYGGPSWYGVWMDFNAPDTENYLYKIFVEEPVAGWEFFQQPSGFDAQAENRANLPQGYYERAAMGRPEWWIRRFIRNQWGYSRDGKPVFEEFNDALHVAAAPLEPVPGLPLIIGADAGLSPAASLRQRMASGQWRILDELVCEQGVGPTRFSERLNQLLAERYPGWPKAEMHGYADPSSAYGGDKDGGDRPWIETVAAKTGIRFRPAPGNNNLVLRLEAVRRPMTLLIDGKEPGLLMSPRCKVMRKAYNAGYRYRRIQGFGGRWAEEPEKNEFSHVADADQYAALGGGEAAEVLGRKQRSGPVQTQAIDDEHPHGVFAGPRRNSGFAIEE